MKLGYGKKEEELRNEKGRRRRERGSIVRKRRKGEKGKRAFRSREGRRRSISE